MKSGTIVAALFALSISANAAQLLPPRGSKVSADLLALEAEQHAALRSNGAATIEHVVIDTAAAGDPEALAEDLRSLGASKVTVFGRVVSAVLPIDAISALSRLQSLHLARPAYMAHRRGEVTSQGDAAVRADVSRPAFGIDGTGVMVGTLSDSFNCHGGAGAGIASGDLPAGTLVLEEGPCIWSALDEGRAMMEIVSDVAPGVRHAFHTAHFGQANFAQGILALAGAGADIINDDVTYLTEPFFQDGIIAQAIDLVKARGVSYFSASGNDGRQSYEAPFRPSNVFLEYWKGTAEAHDFDPGPEVDACMNYTVPQGQYIQFVYQWDQPFFSVSGPPGSASDMDIIIGPPDCDFSVANGGSTGNNLGGDPLEFFDFLDLVNDKFGMMILHHSGAAPGLMKVVVTGPGATALTFDEFGTKTGASWGHSGARGGLGVGAADYQRTPAFGIDPPRVSAYSSAGGSPILFHTAGNRLARPDVRQQPEIVAPSGGDTTFFGGTLDGVTLLPVDTDGTGFPNFAGTSAATPHAAGVAALMKDLVPSLTPDEIYTALKRTAIDMDDPSTAAFDRGVDFGTGFGLVQADRALNEVAPTPAPIPPVDRPDIPPDLRPEPAPPAIPTTPGDPIQPPMTPPPALPIVPVPPPARSDHLCIGVTATIVGTQGNDIIIGTSGHDVIHGLGGNDVIRGGGGRDTICGGPGKDGIFGEEGRDKLFGEGGADRLNGGSGRDRCTGGRGRDRAVSC
jgi:subtilisin family serine protease